MVCLLHLTAILPYNAIHVCRPLPCTSRLRITFVIVLLDPQKLGKKVEETKTTVLRVCPRPWPKGGGKIWSGKWDFPGLLRTNAYECSNTLYIPVMNRNIYITISSEILQYANQFCLINTWDPHFLHDNGCPFLLIAFSSQLEPWATLLTKLGLARLIDLGDPESYSWLWDIDDIVSSRSPHFFKQCANPPRELRVRRLNNHIRVSVAKPTN